MKRLISLMLKSTQTGFVPWTRMEIYGVGALVQIIRMVTMNQIGWPLTEAVQPETTARVSKTKSRLRCHSVQHILMLKSLILISMMMVHA